MCSVFLFFLVEMQQLQLHHQRLSTSEQRTVLRLFWRYTFVHYTCTPRLGNIERLLVYGCAWFCCQLSYAQEKYCFAMMKLMMKVLIELVVVVWPDKKANRLSKKLTKSKRLAAKKNEINAGAMQADLWSLISANWIHKFQVPVKEKEERGKDSSDEGTAALQRCSLCREASETRADRLSSSTCAAVSAVQNQWAVYRDRIEAV